MLQTILYDSTKGERESAKKQENTGPTQTAPMSINDENSPQGNIKIEGLEEIKI